MSNNRKYDKNLVFSEEQVLDDTDNTASTNQIDLGDSGFGEGNRVDGKVYVGANSGGISIKVAHSDSDITTLSASTTEYVANKFDIADGETGEFNFTLPTNIKQKVKMFYSAGTSGTVSSRLTAKDV